MRNLSYNSLSIGKQGETEMINIGNKKSFIIRFLSGFAILLLSFTTTACSSNKTNTVKIPSIFQHLDNLKLVNKADYLTSQKNFPLTYDSLQRGYHDAYMFITENNNKIMMCHLGHKNDVDKVIGCELTTKNKYGISENGKGIRVVRNEVPQVTKNYQIDFYTTLYGVGPVKNLVKTFKVLPKTLSIGRKINIPFAELDSSNEPVPDNLSDEEFNTELTCFVKDQFTQGCMVINQTKTIAHGFWIDTKGTHTF